MILVLLSPVTEVSDYSFYLVLGWYNVDNFAPLVYFNFTYLYFLDSSDQHFYLDRYVQFAN